MLETSQEKAFKPSHHVDAVCKISFV